MRIICNSEETYLEEIPAIVCGLSLDQIVRLAFQFLPVGAVAPTFDSAGVPPTPITALASWTPALSATDDAKKIITTPLFGGMVIPSSEENAGTGDNNTPFGIPPRGNPNAIRVTGQFRNIPTATKNALHKIEGLSGLSLGASRIGIYAVNQFGQLAYSQVGTKMLPLPIYNFFVASRGSEGLGADDIIPFSFWMPADWDRTLAMAQPVFNALTEI